MLAHHPHCFFIIKKKMLAVNKYPRILNTHITLFEILLSKAPPVLFLQKLKKANKLKKFAAFLHC